jgi:tetratricopeptide (TPR) repeat protein
MNDVEAHLMTVFSAALDCESAADRAAYLDRACAGDAALRERVEALLRAHARGGEFLGPAAGQAPTAGFLPEARGAFPDAAPILGAVIAGRYKLLERLGEGGMGEVWMAGQTEPVRRKVALKLIKPGMDSAQVLARFEAERQALALMDHPHIAKVLDGGSTADGRPFFVMELVKGVPITRYCDDHRLSPRVRLGLFVAVCQAVQHAHQKGVIHRDIKPSNVLVAPYDGVAVPKVIDFGIAKAAGQPLTDRTLFTAFGAVVGTPEYMSPEQAELNNQDIDTRSDVYSLGVLLYELLTGTTPLTRKRLKGAALLEVLRLVREEEPPRPSTRLSTTDELPKVAANRGLEPRKLSGLVRGELDWIVMKALEKDRNRRYESANGLCHDVRRYLADEPVQACPPSAWYRFWKFARRNKPALTVAGVVLLLIGLLGAGGGWVFRDRAAREQEIARDRAARSAAIDTEANVALNEADRFQEHGKWPAALEATRRAHGFVAGGEGSEAVRARVQDRLADLEMVVRLQEVSVRMQSAAANSTQFNYQVGDKAYAEAFRNFGVDVEALGVAEAGERLRGRSVRVELATALEDWASTRRARSNAGDKTWNHLIQVAQATDPRPWRQQLWDALAPAGGPPDRGRLVALARSEEALALPPVALHQLATGLIKDGARDEGIALLRRAWRRYPADFRINQDLTDYLFASNPDEALRHSNAAVALSPSRSGAWSRFGSLLLDKGLYTEARAAFLEAFRLDPLYEAHFEYMRNARKEQGNLDGQIADCRRAVALTPQDPEARYNLGEAIHAAGDLAGAVAAYRKALEVQPESLAAHVSLADALMARGEPEEAIEEYSEVLKRVPNSWNTFRKRGTAYRRRSQWDEAVADYRKVIELTPARHEAYTTATLTDLGRAALHLGTDDPRDSAAVARKVMELYPESPAAHFAAGQMLLNSDPTGAAVAFRKAAEGDPENAVAHEWLARALSLPNAGATDLQEALAALSKAVALEPNNLGYWTNRGVIYSRLGRREEASADFNKVNALIRESSVAWLREGDLDAEAGQWDKAVEAYTRSLSGSGGHVALVGRARAYRKLGKWEQCTADYGRAVGLAPNDSGVRNEFAWHLATCPEARVRNPKQAVAYARQAVSLVPGMGAYWNTLGVAQYRAGDWKAAVEGLEKSCALSGGGDAGDWLFLALAHRKLGHDDEARKAYDRAVEWLEKNKALLEKDPERANELGRFRGEAEEVLGLKK